MSNALIIKIEANVQWMVSEQPSGTLVAFCEPLGVATEGGNKLDLYQNIQEAIQLVLNNLLKCGELDEFLRSHGWKSVPIPSDVSSGPVGFEVPIELIQQEQARRDSARTAH